MKHYNWLTQNSKLKKSSGVKTYNWGIPAYKSSNGFKTCPNAAACAKGCYATMGGYIFSNVSKVFEKRFELSLSNDFVPTIIAEIKRRKIERLRIHDSGDFYNTEYIVKWFTIMRECSNVQFYAYSKMVTQFKELQAQGLIPTNFKLIYSYGGTQDKLINPHIDRHSKVFESLEQLQAEGYADASNDDAVALGPNPKIGLVYHGVKSFSNTNWSKVKAA
jgi:hypothetical protein